MIINPLFRQWCNNFPTIIFIVMQLSFPFVEFEPLIKLRHFSNYSSWYCIRQDFIFVLGDYCDYDNHNDSILERF